MRSAPSLRGFSKIVKCVDLPLNDLECFLLSVCLSSPGDRQCDVLHFVLCPQVVSQMSVLICFFPIAFNPQAYKKHSATNFTSSCQIKIQISSISSLVRVLPVCLLL